MTEEKKTQVDRANELDLKKKFSFSTKTKNEILVSISDTVYISRKHWISLLLITF